EAAPTPVAPVTAPPPEGTRGPTAEERELEAALKGERIQGRISIPNQSAGVLVQPEGRDWRVFHNRTLPWVAGTAVVGTVVLLALFFLIRGRVRVREGFSGRTMLRFTFFERAVHWMTASSFIVLALSGLNLTFGRDVLRPVIGPEAFTTLSHWGKTAHNFLAFPFTLGILLLFIMWVGGNLPTRGDVTWLMQGGGMIGHTNPKADRFNAGQKGIFWITVLGGAAVAVSGYLLVFPFTVLDVNGQQWAHMVHGIISAVMMAAILAHIYIGTLGMEGAFSAMGSGQVDYNWAREHHELWVDQELAKAHDTVRPGSGGPAPRPAGAD
ncbi:formate dehydrogenase subunit gamma, partial [Teichococcus wenyumeiae]